MWGIVTQPFFFWGGGSSNTTYLTTTATTVDMGMVRGHLLQKNVDPSQTPRVNKGLLAAKGTSLLNPPQEQHVQHTAYGSLEIEK